MSVPGRRRGSNAEALRWRGAYSQRGLLGEVTIALGAVAVLTIILTILFSSPDQKPTTIRQWSLQDPIDFLQTAVAELAGTSNTAEYGPPYNHKGEGQHAAFLHPQRWLGVSHPIDTARDFVIDPLRAIPDPTLQGEISEYEGAPEGLKLDGINSVEKALTRTPVASDRSVPFKPGEYENVDNIMKALLRLAQSGGLDDYLLTGGQSLQTDYTKPLLFMADGQVLTRRAQRQHLPAHQWAMMDETGSYPGLAWMWPYTFWYEVQPFRSSGNADILVWLIMAALAVIFVCVPLIPGLRSIPRAIPVHRLIWRERYRPLRG